ncbi:MAG: hypothetical protein RLZZ597_3003 [Cyanobacteriota bacterium]|jgi:predicted metal-dependent hydrolase
MPEIPTSVDVALHQGIDLFNRGAYYDCHDVLEALWMEANPTDKPFYQGMLQIAVGLYHLANGNWRGATILLGEGVNRLRPFEPSYYGVAVADLVDNGWAWLMALQQVGEGQVADLAQAAEEARGSSLPIEITLATTGERLKLPRPIITLITP